MYRDYRRVEGYPDYVISNYGEVYSTLSWRGTEWREMKCFMNRSGYKRVSLRKDNIKKHICIHVLVGNAFIGLREGKMTFDHIDRNNQNNRADNIRLATRSEQEINKNLRKDNRLGVKCISSCFKCNVEYFEIRIHRLNKQVFKKYLNKKKYTLEDAKKVRDDFLLTC